jgi:tRNA (mo5U34)-methyltransferase
MSNWFTRWRPATTPIDALPVDGYAPALLPLERLDRLTQEDLNELNRLLKWNCFTVDAHGRRFGDRARAGKREEPQVIPDRRIALFDGEFGLAGKHVLEVGCFEAIHTIALCHAADRVTAIDARMENIVKSILRCHFYGVQPDLRRCDVEIPQELAALPEVDLLHHVGVLYHLRDPVQHLSLLAPKVRTGMMLDTHVARPDEATATLRHEGRDYRCRQVPEHGVAEVFSGMYAHAHWLVLDDLLALLQRIGFAHTRVHETRNERNGTRVLIFARR